VLPGYSLVALVLLLRTTLVEEDDVEVTTETAGRTKAKGAGVEELALKSGKNVIN
jgi:hypothetical protein